MQKRSSNRRQRFGELKQQHAREVWGGRRGGVGCYTVDIPVPYCLHRRIISALTDGVIGTFDVPRRTKLHRSMTASGAPCDGSDRNTVTGETYQPGTYQCHNSAHASWSQPLWQESLAPCWCQPAQNCSVPGDFLSPPVGINHHRTRPNQQFIYWMRMWGTRRFYSHRKKACSEFKWIHFEITDLCSNTFRDTAQIVKTLMVNLAHICCNGFPYTLRKKNHSKNNFYILYKKSTMSLYSYRHGHCERSKTQFSRHSFS